MVEDVAVPVKGEFEGRGSGDILHQDVTGWNVIGIGRGVAAGAFGPFRLVR